jgi:hypothetical protein
MSEGQGFSSAGWGIGDNITILTTPNTSAGHSGHRWTYESDNAL